MGGAHAGAAAWAGRERAAGGARWKHVHAGESNGGLLGGALRGKVGEEQPGGGHEEGEPPRREEGHGRLPGAVCPSATVSAGAVGVGTRRKGRVGRRW